MLCSYEGMIIRPTHYEDISDDNFLESLEGKCLWELDKHVNGRSKDYYSHCNCIVTVFSLASDTRNLFSEQYLNAKPIYRIHIREHPKNA